MMNGNLGHKTRSSCTQTSPMNSCAFWVSLGMPTPETDMERRESGIFSISQGVQDLEVVCF